MFILLWYGVERSDEATEDSLERFTGKKEFLPLTFDSLLGNCPVGMSIPMSFVEDIVGLEGGVLVLNTIVEMCDRHISSIMMTMMIKINTDNKE